MRKSFILRLTGLLALTAVFGLIGTDAGSAGKGLPAI